MPLHCGIFYVAYIVPRAAGSPPVYSFNSGQFPGRPFSQPPPPANRGGSCAAPLSPATGVFFSCTAVCLLRLRHAAGGAFALQPAAASGFADLASPAPEPLPAADARAYALTACFPGTRRASPVTITVSVITPASPIGINPFRPVCVLIIAQACPNRKAYS